MSFDEKLWWKCWPAASLEGTGIPTLHFNFILILIPFVSNRFIIPSAVIPHWIFIAKTTIVWCRTQPDSAFVERAGAKPIISLSYSLWVLFTHRLGTQCTQSTRAHKHREEKEKRLNWRTHLVSALKTHKCVHKASSKVHEYTLALLHKHSQDVFYSARHDVSISNTWATDFATAHYWEMLLGSLGKKTITSLNLCRSWESQNGKGNSTAAGHMIYFWSWWTSAVSLQPTSLTELLCSLPKQFKTLGVGV